MTTIIANASVRTIAAGIAVNRPAANLPATATGNIFVVSGGRIMVVALVAEVTTVIQNQACTLAFGATPTVGSANNTLLGTGASIIAAAVGAHVAANVGGAAAADLGNGAGVSISANWAVVPVGNITATTSATNTGQVKYDLIYVPLDIGAQVVAA